MRASAVGALGELASTHLALGCAILDVGEEYRRVLGEILFDPRPTLHARRGAGGCGGSAHSNSQRYMCSVWGSFSINRPYDRPEEVRTRASRRQRTRGKD